MRKEKDTKAKATRANPKARVGGVLLVMALPAVEEDVEKDAAIKAKEKENIKESQKANQKTVERKAPEKAKVSMFNNVAYAWSLVIGAQSVLTG
jgi:hypothetical protein